MSKGEYRIDKFYLYDGRSTDNGISKGVLEDIVNISRRHKNGF
jgi:hypothetical protein